MAVIPVALTMFACWMNYRETNAVFEHISNDFDSLKPELEKLEVKTLTFLSPIVSHIRAGKLLRFSKRTLLKAVITRRL